MQSAQRLRQNKNLVRVVLVSAATFSGVLVAQQPQPIPVHKIQGTSHAFLVLRAESGAVLGYGELLQLIHGDRVNSRLTYHFRDGSIDDDTTVFSQRTAFHLIRDHHVQHGPFFSKASDCLVEENGDITIRTVGNDGKVKIETNHIDLPPDVSNGFTGTLLLNTPPNSGPFKLGLVAPIGKGRLIRLSVDIAGEEPFSPVIGVRRKATVFRVHPELGGIAGVVAPVIGKQPKDVFVWILEGDVPGLVREIGPLEQGGTVVSVEPAGASYPPAVKVKSSRGSWPHLLYRVSRQQEVVYLAVRDESWRHRAVGWVARNPHQKRNYSVSVIRGCTLPKSVTNTTGLLC